MAGLGGDVEPRTARRDDAVQVVVRGRAALVGRGARLGRRVVRPVRRRRGASNLSSGKVAPLSLLVK